VSLVSLNPSFVDSPFPSFMDPQTSEPKANQQPPPGPFTLSPKPTTQTATRPTQTLPNTLSKSPKPTQSSARPQSVNNTIAIYISTPIIPIPMLDPRGPITPPAPQADVPHPD